jgi:NAD(P)-dependent dehydrogenase (short-subunit alcohol dehydrogenase family)
VARRQTVMITGASAGVGRATAIEFARRGARLGLIARGRAGLEAARRDVIAAGGDALVFEADVAHADAIDTAAEALAHAYGPVDVWVNNAMVSVFSPIREMTPDEYARVTAVTYLGTVHGTLAALRQMRPRDQGVIVQVGSALAYRGIPLQSAYCAAKHAVQGFCDSLRAELLHDQSRIRVTAVQLPALNTPQFEWVKSRLPGRAQPVPPIFQPEVAARAIVWAADHDRREIYLGWPTVQAVVGNKLAPGLADHYLGRHGYDSQQTDEAEDPDRPHNLWAPVDRDRDMGVHGRFDDRARSWSWEFALDRHRGLLAGALSAAALAAWWVRRARAAHAG